MCRHHASGPPLASMALLLVGLASGASASPPRDHDQVPGNRDGGNAVQRSLQTCNPAEGFTVISNAFPLMSGCYAEEEVPQNGGGSRLAVMQYRSSDRLGTFAVSPYDPYFGYRWRAYVREGSTSDYSSVLACETNENIGMDLQPADPTLTWECDLDGDGIMETPTATDAMLSLSCGCAASPSSAPITPSSTTPAPATLSTPAPITPAPTALEPTAATTTTPEPVEVNPSTCPNGMSGVAKDEVCCAEACNTCGGVNCGTITGTNGSSDCCTGVIIASGVLCNDTGAAPCVMTTIPSPAALYDLTMAPTTVTQTAAPTTGYGSRGGDFGSVGPTGSPAAFVPTSTLSPSSTLFPGATTAPGAIGSTLTSGEVTASPMLVGESVSNNSNSGETLIAVYGTGRVVRLAVMVSGVFAAFAATRA